MQALGHHMRHRGTPEVIWQAESVKRQPRFYSNAPEGDHARPQTRSVCPDSVCTGSRGGI